MKKLISFTFMLILLLASVFAAADEYNFVSTSDSFTTFDLSRSYYSNLVPGQTYQESEYTALCQAGAYSSLSSSTRIEVSCNYIDKDGNFIMVSSSSNGLSYRKFKVACNYMTNVNQKYFIPITNIRSGSTGSFYYAKDTSTSHVKELMYTLPVRGSVKVKYGSTTYTPWLFYVDIIIVFDDPADELDHLTPASDYQAVLTVTVISEDGKYPSYTYSIPINGYYETVPEQEQTSCTLVVSNYGSIISMKDMDENRSHTYQVGKLFFQTLNTSSTANLDKWQIRVYPDPDYTFYTGFALRKTTDTTFYYPIEVILEGTDIVTTNAKSSVYSNGNYDTKSGVKYFKSASSGEAFTVKTATIKDYAFVVNGDSSDHNGTTYYNKYEANVLIKANTNVDLPVLTSGKYYCNLNFEIITP